MSWGSTQSREAYLEQNTMGVYGNYNSRSVPKREYHLQACFFFETRMKMHLQEPRKLAAHLADDMFSLYMYLIVNLVFSHLGFCSGNFFLKGHFLIIAYCCLDCIQPHPSSQQWFPAPLESQQGAVMTPITYIVHINDFHTFSHF